MLTNVKNFNKCNKFYQILNFSNNFQQMLTSINKALQMSINAHKCDEIMLSNFSQS